MGTAVFDRILDLLFPPKCPFCRELLTSRAALLCDRCQKDLPWTQPGPWEQTIEFISSCVSPLYYRDLVRESIHRYKFSGRSCYSEVYGLLMAQAVQDAWPDVLFDAVTWVPLSKRRKRQRGYDQAQLLAEAVCAQRASAPVPLLRKVRNTPAQSLQTAPGARRVNVLNAYAIAPHVDVRGKTLLLCDDVVTTGSTLSECARILRTAGVEKVYAVTLARSQHIRPKPTDG